MVRGDMRREDDVNQEDSEQNKIDGIKKRVHSSGKVMHI